MKGFTEVLTLIALLVAMAMIAASISVDLPWSKGQIERIIFQQNLYIMQNALNAAKLYLQTAFHYSVYQAVYDNGKRGGWHIIPSDRQCDSYACWYNSSDISPSIEEFSESLENSTKDNLNIYASEDYSFLTDYKVNLPTYDDVKVENHTLETIRIHANSSENLRIEPPKREVKESIELEKNPLLNETYQIRYYKLFNLSKNFVNDGGKNEINETQFNVLKPWPKSGEKSETECSPIDASFPIVTEEEVFINATLETFGEEKNFGQAKSEISTSISNDINSLEDSLNARDLPLNIKWEINIKEGPAVTITPTCDDPIEERGECCLCNMGTDCSVCGAQTCTSCAICGALTGTSCAICGALTCTDCDICGCADENCTKCNTCTDPACGCATCADPAFGCATCTHPACGCLTCRDSLPDCPNFGCEKDYKTTTRVCTNFEYKVNTKVKINLTDQERKWPVYDSDLGKTLFNYISLIFFEIIRTVY